ncbi:lytic transglycosylase domain-containing protein [Nitratireductor basaltis]|nr:lytic transglycosylase domain-containing protein [Nitratireductor basaltis]
MSPWRSALLAGIFLMLVPSAHAAKTARDMLPRICQLLEEHADANGISPHFFARLIWKESLFRPDAVSHKGAQGIAQFIPSTARLRGLKNAFDIEQAIPASASYLADLKRQFGNSALAAAAYNSGENRVARWILRGGNLPAETEDYVYSIFGKPAESFRKLEGSVDIPPLKPDLPFQKACMLMPVSSGALHVQAPRKPWGVQVAGHFNRGVALRLWEQTRRKLPANLRNISPNVDRVKSTRGSKRIYAVRLGADSRAEAERMCTRMRQSGGACIVVRNR